MPDEPLQDVRVAFIDEGDDVMDATYQNLIDTLDEERHAADQWDEPPALLIYSRGTVVSVGSGVLLQMQMRELPIPAEAWDNRPGDVFQLLAAGMRGSGLYEPGSLRDWVGDHDVVAVAFVCEGWMVSAAREDDPTLTAMAERRTLHQHKERVEVRMIHLVDVAGGQFSIFRPRGQDVQRVHGPETTGDVIDGMHALLDSLTFLQSVDDQ